jgi:hypothetical protein
MLIEPALHFVSKFARIEERFVENPGRFPG